MESKVNINPYKPPQFKKQPNASFEKAKTQDLNRITELYTTFKTMDYEEIMAVIETNEILNFKTDKGETLIFALLNNPSSTLNESKIKNIIELLVVKNVSINAMNEFNQNVLHLACKKGYFFVIDYLLSLKCNRELVDNYGNAPIHYVIEEFIRDCKGGEMYNYKNLKLKYLHDNVDVDYLSKLMMVSIIEEVDSIKRREGELLMSSQGSGLGGAVQVGGSMTDQPLTMALDHLKKFIGLNRLFKGEEIVMQMEDNITKLGDRYVELLSSTEQKVIKSELQKKIVEQKKDYEQLYASFKVSMDDIDNFDSFNDYARQIEVKIASEKAACNKKIKESFDVRLKEKCDELNAYVVNDGNVYELYDNELYLSYLLYYIYQNLNAFEYDADEENDPVNKIFHKIQDILKKSIVTKNWRYIDYSKIKFVNDYDMQYKPSDDYISQQYSTYMLDKVDFDNRNTRLTPLLFIYEWGVDDDNIRYFGNQIFNTDFLNYLSDDSKGYTPTPITYDQAINQLNDNRYMFKLDNIKMLCDYVNRTMDMIKDNYKGDDFIGNNGDNNICEMIISIYTLYEIILNVINNLILIKYDVQQHVNTDTLKLEIIELKQLMNAEIVLKDNNKRFNLDGNGDIDNVDDYDDRTNTAAEFFEGIIKNIDDAIKHIIKGVENIDSTLNKMYKQLMECIDIINQVINEKNKFFSLTYLEKYIACFKEGGVGARVGEEDVRAGVGDISCIFYNRLREINTSIFPETFTEYYLKYEAVARVQPQPQLLSEVNLIDSMPDLPTYLVYMHNYNFNIFFKEGDLYPISIPHLELELVQQQPQPPQPQLRVWAVSLIDLDVNIDNDNQKYSTGYFLCLYEGDYERKKGDVDNLYPPINERMNEQEDGQYQFIHQSKQALRVCVGTDDTIMPIALEHTGYIMKIIIAKIVFVVREKQGQEEGEEYGGGNMRGGAYSSIIQKVISKIESQKKTQQQAELVKILQSLQKNPTLLKKFINKYILSLVEKNISIYIGDECGELMSLQVEKLNLEYPDYAQIIKLAELTPLEFRKGKNTDEIIALIINTDTSNAVKEIVINIYNKRAIHHKPNSSKVFRNKCANVSMSNFECVKRLGIRLKDRNGNTILNRLIDQYNIPAIRTLIQMDPGIKTFRNNRNQTPQEYIKSLMKIIADKYDTNTIKSRIIKYGYILMSYLEPIALTNVDLELYTSDEFIITVIKYNLYMFNEFLWFRMLEFDNLLTVDEIMAVLVHMGHKIQKTQLKKMETLLASKIDTVVEEVEQRVEIPSDDDEENHKQKQKRLLQENQEEEEGKKSSEERESKEPKIAKISDDIKEKIKEKIKENNKIAQFKTVIDSDKLYEIYYNIVRKCFAQDEYSASACPKTVPIPTQSQPQAQLAIWEIASLLLKLDLKDANDDNINKFFKKFVKKIYEDYYDLDQNEDAEYNYIQHEILLIIFVNVGSMVALELVNRLIIYCDKYHAPNAPDMSRQREGEGEESDDAKKRILVETRDKLYTYAKNAITDEIIEKLGVKNPDKQYTTTDTHDDIIIDALKTAYSFVVGEKDLRDLKQIITFYRMLAENIAKNSYDEMRSILDDLRRKSLLIEITYLLQ